MNSELGQFLKAKGLTIRILMRAFGCSQKRVYTMLRNPHHTMTLRDIRILGSLLDLTFYEAIGLISGYEPSNLNRWFDDDLT